MTRNLHIETNSTESQANPARSDNSLPIAAGCDRSEAGRPFSSNREPIAIVGIGCRFPGGVTSPESFWQLLRDKVNAITEIPSDRMDVARFYDSRPATPGKIMTRWGGFLESIDTLDASFFSISPREAERMDPQQRLLLEVAWEALEDAGEVVDYLAGSRTGVYIGMWLNDYESRMFADPALVDFYMTTGSGRYSASGRLSYNLAFQGPSITIDAACSSSLVAVHLACQSLWRGECSLALAGGVNVILQPHITIAYSQSKMMAPDGRCKFGDAKANGYVRSEGAGIVILKPLARALAEGNPIYALIQGSAVNNDGRSSGYMATPSLTGQAELLRIAYCDAGISPGDVGFIEAHGTGTLVGDPIEIGALGKVLASNRQPGSICYIGSIKSNIGHTEGAAGIAGLIKTALVLKQRAIPANLHLDEPNPNIPWQDLPLQIPRELIPWPEGNIPAIAGVSAFGITGTNAHVVMTEAPPVIAKGRMDESKDKAACLLPLSAQSPGALTALAHAYRNLLTTGKPPSLHDMCYTASCRRTHHEYRVSLVAGSEAELVDRLSSFLKKEDFPGISTGKAEPDRMRKIVFVFPGQGSQWVGMGRQLMMREPAFKEALHRCEVAMQPYVDWSLLEQLMLNPDRPGYRLGDIDVIQPCLLSIELALAELWRSWGVEPNAVVGHSMGEVAAACVVGALSLEDAMRIICGRSLLMRRISGKGAMAVVGLPIDQAKEALAGFENVLSVGVSNSPRSTVLSGEPESLNRVLDRLQSQNVFCRTVNVDVASHSPQIDCLTDDLSALLKGIRPQPGMIPIFSAVNAERVNGTELGVDYWIRNLRQPVLFSRTVQQMAKEDYSIFIELSPHPILLPAIEETLNYSGQDVCAIPSMERDKDERATMLGSIGKLYTTGYPVNWTRFFPVGGQVAKLPSYPWQRQRFWMDVKPSPGSSILGWPESQSLGIPDHPLLGARLPDVAALPGSSLWDQKLDARFREFLRKRYADNPDPLPETLMVEMAMAAANTVFSEKLHRISELVIHQPMTLPESMDSHMQFVLTPSGPGSVSFKIFGREMEQASEWKQHASAKVEIGQADADWLYELEWKLKPHQVDSPGVRDDETGSWLIFADREGLGASIAELLESRGEVCSLVFAGDSYGMKSPAHLEVNPSCLEDMRQLLLSVRGSGPLSCRGIIYLWNLDSVALPVMTMTSLQNSQALSCDGVLHLIQALSQAEWKAAPKLWLVTRGAQAVESLDGTAIALAQAPLWGLGRTIALEHPELWGGLVDLSSSDGIAPTKAEEATALLAEVLGSDGEDQVALRKGLRYVVRLKKSSIAAVRRNQLSILSDATYLITGGLGNLGLKVARWLIDQGAKNLVLVSRTGLPERSSWESIPYETEIGKRVAAIRALEDCGAKIHIAKADVADESRMSDLFEELRRHHPPLRGIIHAAGILARRSLVDLKASDLHEMLQSKVMGAWNLHRFTQPMNGENKRLDFFVLFSSGAAVWGSQGLAPYAAANHFMDALAHHRAALGLPALSVNWGWWAGPSIVTEDLATLFARIGLNALSSEQALAALTFLIEAGAVQTVVADMDWRVFKPVFEAKRSRPLLERVAPHELQTQTESGRAGEESRPSLLHQVHQAAPKERRGLLHGYIRSQVAEILGFDSPEKIDPRQGFFKMGMDSIMTVQLRNRLESSLHCSLPTTVAFEYPTVEAMTNYLAEDVIGVEEPLDSAGDRMQYETKAEARGNPQQALSEEELVDLLAKRLEQIG